MTIQALQLKKTNQIFTSLSAAMKMGATERKNFMDAAGYPISKSKAVNWCSRGKNYVNMPDDALAAFLKHAQTESTSAIIRWVCNTLLNADRYNQLTDDQILAITELTNLFNQEYGYTPQNLRYECTAAGGRSKFAAQYNISESTLDNWCRQLDDPNHRDMPAIKWLEVISQK